MAKRKNNRAVETKRKKAKQDQDARLSTGLFAASGYDDEEPSEPETNDWENDEQDYELKPREVVDEHVKLVEGLPIKTADGRIERVVNKIKIKQKEEEEEEAEIEEKPEEMEPESEGYSEDENADANDGLTPQEKLVMLKEEIAGLVEKLIEEPEENTAALTRLRKMSESKNETTQKLALLALVPAFKAIAPGYRIRALTDTEKREKVSRDIQKLRNFEQNLAVNYKNYIDLLTTLARISTTTQKATPYQIQVGRMAVMAAIELATSLRHFNCRSEIFTILIRRLNRLPSDEGDRKVFTKCITTLEELLNDDETSGEMSLEIVRIMAKTLKDKKFRVDESVLNILLSLLILTDYDPNNNKDDDKPKLKKKDRVHLSKKERKQRKENKEIEEELRKAEQAVTAEEREKNQAQILKTLLTIYLQILKERPDYLMAAVLEGISKYGNMVNIELLSDFLEILREIIQDLQTQDDSFISYNEIRQILLCIVTSFELVSSHQQLKLPIDLSQFIDSLYYILPYLSFDADIEFSHKSLRLQDPLSTVDEDFKPSVNVSTKVELLLKSLDKIFFKSKSGTKIRYSAFTKRIYTSMLQTPEKSSIALLKFVDKLMARNAEISGLYSTEDRINNGVFHLETDELERSNPNAATLWENVLLNNHYCPTIAHSSRALFNKSKGTTSQ